MAQQSINQPKKPGLMSFAWTIPVSIVCYSLMYTILLFKYGQQSSHGSVYAQYSGWILLFLTLLVTYQIIKNINYSESKNNTREVKNKTQRPSSLFQTSFTLYITSCLFNLIIFVLDFFLGNSIGLILLFFTVIFFPIQAITQVLNQFQFLKNSIYIPTLFWIFVTIATFSVFNYTDSGSFNRTVQYIINRDLFNFSSSIIKPLIVSSFISGIIDFFFYMKLQKQKLD
ncbi:MAG: hypothetical protein WCK98_01880 [bacterium]